MNEFSMILTRLQAAIAVVSARERHLTVLLVAVWGRIARMRTRMERLVAQWRAGTLPAPRASRAGQAIVARGKPRFIFPNGRTWLGRMVRDALPCGNGLQNLLTDAEWQAFLAAVPQAARIFRPLFHMLGVDPVPEAVRRVRPVVVVSAPAPAPVAEMVGVVVAPVSHFLGA